MNSLVEPRLYLEDLREGMSFLSGTYALEAEELKQFAGQYDPQPFHLDHEAALPTLFGGLAASGWHTAAITMRLLVGSGINLVNGLIGAGGEITWPQPTRPGDILQVESRIIEIRPSRSKPDRGIVLLEILTRNQHGELLQRFVARLVVFRRFQP